MQNGLLGKKALNWLLNGSERDAVDFVNNLSLMNLLCYYLVQEGEEELIWAWLTAHIPHFDSIDDRFLAYKWRGFLLHDLVLAKLNATPKNANSAVEAMLRALDLKQTANRVPPGNYVRTISIRPAI